MARDERNPNPVVLANRSARKSSAQVKDYLLCEECEATMRVNGEDWLLKHCCRSIKGTPFLLRDKLRKLTPIYKDSMAALLETNGSKEITPEKLLYFGVSIFWRAAQKPWHLIGQIIEPIKLGAYDEKLRLFLLGHSRFPDDAALSVWVSDQADPWMSLSPPQSLARNEHMAYMLGIGFCLGLGNRIPDHLKIANIASRKNPVILSAHIEQRMRDGMKLMAKDWNLKVLNN